MSNCVALFYHRQTVSLLLWKLELFISVKHFIMCASMEKRKSNQRTSLLFLTRVLCQTCDIFQFFRYSLMSHYIYPETSQLLIHLIA